MRRARNVQETGCSNYSVDTHNIYIYDYNTYIYIIIVNDYFNMFRCRCGFLIDSNEWWMILDNIFRC